MRRCFFAMAGLLMLVSLFGLMGCPKEEPEVIDLTGKWIGDIIDSNAGAGVFRAHLLHNGQEITGNWSTDFDGEDMDSVGTLTGELRDSDIFATLTPSREDACPFNATGTASNTSITADYVTIECDLSITGLVDLKRDGESGAGGPPASEWRRSFAGESVVATLQTADGGYMLATTLSGDTTDFQLIKLDPNGLEAWRKVYEGPGNEYCSDMVATTDNGYLLAGSTRDNEANQDAWLLKVDAQGNQVWQQSYGGEGADLASALTPVSAGGFLFVGDTSSAGAGESDCYLVRIDNDGNELWSTTQGGNAEDHAHNVIALADGGFAVVGSTDSFGAIGVDIYLMRIDKEGALLWHNLYGGQSDERGFDLLLSDDGYLIAGITDSEGHGEFDGYLLKVDSAGDLAWTQTYGGLKNDGFVALTPTTNGYLLAGASESFGLNSQAVYAVRINAEGAMQWQAHLEDTNNATAYDVIRTSDGGYLLAGMADFDGNDAYVVKLAAD